MGKYFLVELILKGLTVDNLGKKLVWLINKRLFSQEPLKIILPMGLKIIHKKS